MNSHQLDSVDLGYRRVSNSLLASPLQYGGGGAGFGYDDDSIGWYML
jgi:hypothetical protein